MPFGTGMTNNFLNASLDIWKDKVFYYEQEFPAGYFAASILNITEEEMKALADHGGSLSQQFPVLVKGSEQEALEALPELKNKMLSLVEQLWKLPPFSFNDQTVERTLINAMFAEDALESIRDTDSEGQRFFLSYCTALSCIPLALYHFLIIVWFFESDYLRRLKKRNETHFAGAAHDYFNSDFFWETQQRMYANNIERFTFWPSLESSYVFVRDPKKKEEMIFVNRISFYRFIDFYAYDLFNGLHHGHAPARCNGCGRYFLTTNGHSPKYCDGIAPQDKNLTCRQYGTKMRQKEQNKNHPVYQVFSTRTNTIRKQCDRGQISEELKEAALLLAQEYRDKALLDNAYAAGEYAKDMTQENIRNEAEKRLQKKKERETKK